MNCKPVIYHDKTAHKTRYLVLVAVAVHFFKRHIFAFSSSHTVSGLDCTAFGVAFVRQSREDVVSRMDADDVRKPTSQKIMLKKLM